MSSLIDRLFQHAEQAQDHCAVASRQANWSYAELAERVMAQAERLRELGVTDSSAVGIECDDDVLHLVLCLAAVQLAQPPAH